jgi:hypothetical protein
MKELWNKIVENKTKSTVTVAIVVLLVILGVLFRDELLNNGQNSANISDSEFIQNLIAELEGQDSAEGNRNETPEFSMTEVVDGVTYFNRVMVPVLASPELFDYAGEKTQGCGDEIVWVMKDVDQTRTPLTDSITLLLEDNKDYGFMPGNFMAKQSELSLDNVVIEDAVAKISLNGEFTVDEECDAPRQFIQLEEVALQYSTVNAVQIFLNGELLR